MKKILLCGILFCVLGRFTIFPTTHAETWYIKPIIQNDNTKNIAITYPEFTNDYFNFTIQNYINDAKKEYLQNYQTGQQLIITYDEYVSNQMISYLFYTMYDFKGAHPITFIKSFNFNRNTFDHVTTKTLLSQDDLNRIAGYCYDDLYSRLKNSSFLIEDMLKDGLSPTFDHYKNVIMMDDGMMFFFDQYQVAPYAAGFQHCFVPYSILSTYPTPRTMNE